MQAILGKEKLIIGGEIDCCLEPDGTGLIELKKSTYRYESIRYIKKIRVVATIISPWSRHSGFWEM